MPKHICLDPHDPFAEREVVVEFEHTECGICLIAVIDADGDDILSDLIDVQRADLRYEIAEIDRIAGLGPSPTVQPMIAVNGWCDVRGRARREPGRCSG